jgi:hypothetical protein
MAESKLNQGGHPDTSSFGVAGGTDFAPRGRKAVRGFCPSRKERDALTESREHPPAGFTGLWGSHYYVRGAQRDDMRNAGAFAKLAVLATIAFALMACNVNVIEAASSGEPAPVNECGWTYYGPVAVPAASWSGPGCFYAYTSEHYNVVIARRDYREQCVTDIAGHGCMMNGCAAIGSVVPNELVDVWANNLEPDPIATVYFEAQPAEYCDRVGVP